MTTLKPVLTAAMLALLAMPAAGHESWLEPLAYVLEPGAAIAAELHNGEEFSGSRYPYNTRSFARFEHVHAGATVPVEGRLGDRPAAQVGDVAEGLHVLVYQSVPQKLTYRDWQKFAAFAEHKGFDGYEAAHLSRGLPRTDFVESYTRFVKALVAVGDGAGADASTGMETELVALDNPYRGSPSEIRVRALYLGRARAAAQIELFEKAPGGTVEITLHRTDAEGVAVLPVKAGHSYLVDAVVLREPAPGAVDGAVWETLWAALTFAVPAR